MALSKGKNRVLVGTIVLLKFRFVPRQIKRYRTELDLWIGSSTWNSLGTNMETSKNVSSWKQSKKNKK